MSYTSITKKIKPMRGRAFKLGGLVASDSELTTADSANQRGIGTRAMVRRRSITTGDYAPKEDFFTKFIKAQDERFSKMKEYKIASSTDEDMLYGSAPIAGSDDEFEFLKKLGMSESSNDYSAVNKEGYSGKYQTGKDRFAGWKEETGYKGSYKTFKDDPQAQENEALHAVKKSTSLWNKKGFENKIPLNSFRAVYHLGGPTGAIKYTRTRHLSLDDPKKYNPPDSNGTRLSDYDKKFGGNK